MIDINDFFVIIYIEKAFDSLDHKCLISVLRKCVISSKLYLLDRNDRNIIEKSKKQTSDMEHTALN